MSETGARCVPSDDGWRCTVTVRDATGESTHEVTVSTDAAATLAAATGAPGVERLVDETMDFLLEREPRTSILRAFDVTVVGRYFPEYEHEIRSRLAP
jgi:hypothetical protein